MGTPTFGIFDHIEGEPGTSVAEVLKGRVELIRMVEEAGFAGYHLAEHHGSELCPAPNQELFMAAASQITDRIRMGPMVKLLPLRHGQPGHGRAVRDEPDVAGPRPPDRPVRHEGQTRPRDGLTLPTPHEVRAVRDQLRDLRRSRRAGAGGAVCRGGRARFAVGGRAHRAAEPAAARLCDRA